MHWQRTVSETDAMRARRAGQVGKTRPRDTPPAAGRARGRPAAAGRRRESRPRRRRRAAPPRPTRGAGTTRRYDLPPALSRLGTPFGTSTRQDWEHTYKNKRDTKNPYASPGNYNATGLGVLSNTRSPPSIRFGYSSRAEDYRKKTPGPDYQIEGIFKNGPIGGRIAIGFNKDHRRPMLVNVRVPRRFLVSSGRFPGRRGAAAATRDAGAGDRRASGSSASEGDAARPGARGTPGAPGVDPARTCLRRRTRRTFRNFRRRRRAGSAPSSRWTRGARTRSARRGPSTTSPSTTSGPGRASRSAPARATASRAASWDDIADVFFSFS